MTKIFHTMGSRKRDYVLPEGTNIFVSEEYVEKAIEEAGKNPLPPTAKPKKSTKPKTDPDPNPEFNNPNIDAEYFIPVPGTDYAISKFEMPNQSGVNFNSTNWDDEHAKLSQIGLEMPSSRIFMPFFNYVVGNYLENKPILDARGKPIDKKEHEKMYKHLIENHYGVYGDSNPGAWSWLNDLFEQDSSGLLKLKHGKIVNGNLEFQIEDLDMPINTDCYVDFKTMNSQGFPTTEKGTAYQKGKNIRFISPVNGSVAGFGADSGGADLNCDRDRSASNAVLGVFGMARSASLENLAVDKGDRIYFPQLGIEMIKTKLHNGLDFDKTDQKLKEANLRMIRLSEFPHVINALQSNPQYSGLVNEILEVREPWRSTHLGGDFKTISGVMHNNYRGVAEKLENYLSTNKLPGISLDEYLRNPTINGLPFANISDGNLYYWAPTEGNVARFCACSDGGNLDCSWDRSGSGARLRVFAVREAHAPRIKVGGR